MYKNYFAEEIYGKANPLSSYRLYQKYDDVIITIILTIIVMVSLGVASFVNCTTYSSYFIGGDLIWSAFALFVTALLKLLKNTAKSSSYKNFGIIIYSLCALLSFGIFIIIKIAPMSTLMKIQDYILWTNIFVFLVSILVNVFTVHIVLS